MITIEQNNEIVLGEYVGLLKTAQDPKYKNLATAYVESNSETKELNKEFFEGLVQDTKLVSALLLNAPWLWESDAQRMQVMQYINHTLSPSRLLDNKLNSLSANLPSGIFLKLVDRHTTTTANLEKWNKEWTIMFELNSNMKQTEELGILEVIAADGTKVPKIAYRKAVGKGLFGSGK